MSAMSTLKNFDRSTLAMLADLGVSPESIPQPKGRRKTKPTTDLTNSVITLLNLKGYFAWRVNTGSFWAPIGGGRYRPVKVNISGISDVCAVSPNGRACFFEVKFGADKMRDTQISFRDAVVKRGALYVEVRTIEDVENSIKLDAAQ